MEKLKEEEENAVLNKPEGPEITSLNSSEQDFIKLQK
jgi:hypothetical protein